MVRLGLGSGERGPCSATILETAKRSAEQEGTMDSQGSDVQTTNMLHGWRSSRDDNRELPGGECVCRRQNGAMAN